MKMLRENTIAAAALIASLSACAFGQSNTCSSATLITTGSYSGTTVGATNDGDGGCGVSQGSPDVWYKIIPAVNRQLVVSTCGAADYDSVLSIHSGCPGNASNALACNDDSCSSTQSTVSATVVAGNTYLIRVSGYQGATGSFTISVSYQDPPPPPTHGPDVWIESLTDIAYYANVNNVYAYAVGTDACNQGDAPVEWQSGTNRHPVIAQNMYRLNNGRFEQIGQSWLKHGFASTNSGACGTCNQPPNGGAQLGVSCSDAYGAGLNGSQGNLGPRSAVNPTTGYYVYPYTDSGYSGDIARRIQVAAADVLPAQNVGASYFVECHYVTQDDANWNNGLNNATYQKIALTNPTAPSLSGVAQRQRPGIQAWQDNDPTVVTSNMDYLEPGIAAGSRITARFILASKVTDNHNGSYTYEYAVENFNSDRAGGSFSIPLPPGSRASTAGFHSVAAHSGEPFASTAWTATITDYDITWTSQTYAQNANANALRWGTLYNFRFTANVPPAAGTATLGLFKPPQSAQFPNTVFGNALTPDLTICVGDFNRDGGFDGDDVSTFFDAWTAGATAADVNGDGGVDGQDVGVFFTHWEAGSC